MEIKSQVASFVAERIRITGKKQVEIAAVAGFDKPNVITMIKQGKTKLPLGKVGPMAKALEADATYLLKLCLEEYQPETWKAIRPYMDDMLTSDEIRFMRAVRNWAGVNFISAFTKEQQSKLNAFINSMQSEYSRIQ